MKVVVDVVEFVELFIELEHYFEDIVSFWILVKQVESLGVQLQGFNHHLLSEHHHY